MPVMFTGLVQTLGRVAAFEPDGHGGSRLRLREPALAQLLQLGESIAVNGACLTVIQSDAETFEFQLGPETLERTALAQLKVDDPVNLERALRVGEALGGHFVTGHIDAVGTIAKRERSGDWENVEFAFPEEFEELLVMKGSIAIDGVSLTVAKTEPGLLGVMLIPHTLAHTTLGAKTVGDSVNLEFDLLAKHVRKLIKNLTITV